MHGIEFSGLMGGRPGEYGLRHPLGAQFCGRGIRPDGERGIECRIPALIASGRQRARMQQQFDRRSTIGSGRIEQRRALFGIERLSIGAMPQQQLQDGRVGLLRRQHQCRRPETIHRAHIRAQVDQHRRGAGLSALGREGQCRAPEFIGDARCGGTEPADPGHVPPAHATHHPRVEQRGIRFPERLALEQRFAGLQRIHGADVAKLCRALQPGVRSGGRGLSVAPEFRRQHVRRCRLSVFCGGLKQISRALRIGSRSHAVQIHQGEQVLCIRVAGAAQ